MKPPPRKSKPCNQVLLFLTFVRDSFGDPFQALYKWPPFKADSKGHGWKKLVESLVYLQSIRLDTQLGLVYLPTIYPLKPTQI